MDLGLFPSLTIVNNATMNMRVQRAFQVGVFVSFGCFPRSRISGSYGSSIFNFLRIFHTVFIVAVLIYNPTNRAQVFPALHMSTTILIFLMMGILGDGMRHHLVGILVYISLISSDV